MPKITTKTDLGVPADIVWQAIGRFGAIGDWNPLIEKSESSGETKGATRKLKLVGGGVLIERLETISDKERVYRYSIVDSPFPVKDCVAEIRVVDEGAGKSTVEWSCDFKPVSVAQSDAAKEIGEIYSAGMNFLKKMFDAG